MQKGGGVAPANNDVFFTSSALVLAKTYSMTVSTFAKDSLGAVSLTKPYAKKFVVQQNSSTSKSKASGDIAGQVFAQKRVECFTAQLNEANPILTDISRAMTKEGIATERMQEAIDKGDSLEKSRWNAVKEIARIDKINGNNRLMECSSKYMEAMKSIREQHLVAR